MLGLLYTALCRSPCLLTKTRLHQERLISWSVVKQYWSNYCVPHGSKIFPQAPGLPCSLLGMHGHPCLLWPPLCHYALSFECHTFSNKWIFTYTIPFIFEHSSYDMDMRCVQPVLCQDRFLSYNSLWKSCFLC